MSPLSLPVLGGAALLTSPALWRALVLGTGSVEVALTRYLVTAAICWALLALVTMLVGPAPRPERPAADAADAAGLPDVASDVGVHARS